MSLDLNYGVRGHTVIWSGSDGQAVLHTPSNWGEPERAPHLMMSTAVCMFVVHRTYGKHSPEDELMGTSGSTCTLIIVSFPDINSEIA